MFCFIKCGVVRFRFPFNTNIHGLGYNIRLQTNQLSQDMHEPLSEKYSSPSYGFQITLTFGAWARQPDWSLWRDFCVLQQVSQLQSCQMCFSSLPRWPGWQLLLQKWGCTQASKRHIMYSKEKTTKSPRKIIQMLSFPSSLLDTLGR